MAPKAAATKKSSAGASSHGSYQEMIRIAILNLKERKGSSRQAIKKYIKSNNDLGATTDAAFNSHLNRALSTGEEQGVFERPKGPSGPVKLKKPATGEAKPAAAKSAAPKKTAAAKSAASKTKKATTAKKATTGTTTKKAAAKPKANTSKKTATAPAPAVEEKPAVVTGKTKSGRVTKSKAPQSSAKKTAPKKAAAKKAAPKKAATPKKE